VRELARGNATGRLRLTQNGKIREILIESGVPVFASSSIPEEQPEHRLVVDGLITPEQLSAAMVTARQTSQPVEKILVQAKVITRLGLQRTLCELSTTIVNCASEWVTGEYAFAAAPKVPLEAKLIWSPTECILAGARHASSKSSVLDALAPDERIVKPASDPEATAANSASLSSTEGYVLSCIQSSTTIAETSMLTGLSHIETRRAILVLIMLGLLEPEPSSSSSPSAASIAERDGPTRPAGNTSTPAPRAAQPTEPVIRTTPEQRQPSPNLNEARAPRPVVQEQRPSSRNLNDVRPAPVAVQEQRRPSPNLNEAAAAPSPVQEQRRPSPNLNEAAAAPSPVQEQRPPSRNLNDVRPAPRTAEPTQSVIGSEPPRGAQNHPSSSSADRSRVLPAQLPANGGTTGVRVPGNQQADAWPLDLDSAGQAGLDDDGLDDDYKQIDFNSGDLSFLDFPEPSKSPENSRRERSHQSRDPYAHRNGDSDGIAAVNHQSVRQEAAPPPASVGSIDPPLERSGGSIFIPNSAIPQSPANGKNNSIILPNSPSQTTEARGPAPLPPEQAPPARDNTRHNNGSISMPPAAVRHAQPPVDSTSAPKTAAPSRGNSGFIPGWAVPPERGGARTSPLAPPEGPVAASTPSTTVPGSSRPTPKVPDTPSPVAAAPPRTDTRSTFIPGLDNQSAPRDASSPVPPFRANTGSAYLPDGGTSERQSHSQSLPPPARMREQPFTRDDRSAPPSSQTLPPPVRQASPADSQSGYGYNGEADPRLHQEWRNQQEAAPRQDNADEERFLKRVIDEINAKIRIAATADYYQILGVDKLASNGSITKAYERIARINDSHKSRWPHNSELQSQISSLMVVVNKAYETLGTPEKRRIYDMPPKQQTPVMEIERGSGSVTGSIGGRTSAPPPVRPSPGASSSRPLPGGPPLVPPAPSPADNRNPIEAAADLFRRGRGAFARSDLQAAAHLLRQAVNLDPQQSTYHYQLGMTLFILSQARAEHKHDKGCHVTCKMGGNLTRNQRIRHEAEQHLLKASELEPSNSDIKLKLALLYKDAHMDRKAHQYFYEALMLDPNCQIARVELGMEDKKESAEDQWIKDLMSNRTKKK
jgi:tetratricopeptide (TPR) repeat protein